jgi:hypothetical protein
MISYDYPDSQLPTIPNRMQTDVPLDVHRVVGDKPLVRPESFLLNMDIAA